jgi:hypothetical protein
MKAAGTTEPGKRKGRRDEQERTERDGAKEGEKAARAEDVAFGVARFPASSPPNPSTKN